MMKLMHYVAAGCWFAYASSAWAFIGVQAQMGKRQGQMGSDASKVSFKGTELDLSAQLDPVPLVPIAVGASVTYQTLTFDNPNIVDDFKGFLVSPFVSAWIPNPTDFTPFARIGYTVYGRLSGTGDGEAKAEYAIKGPCLSLGLRYSLLPLISLLGEYQVANQTAEPVSVKKAGIDILDESKSVSFKSQSILVGVMVNL